MNSLISGQAIFIVCREALEAILVVGILYAYLCKTDRRGLKAMWWGVAIGLFLSLVLAWIITVAQDVLEGRAQVYFESGVLALSAGLMTQMVFWMRKHGRHLKRELETGLQDALTRSSLIGIASLAALSVAREGSEAVIYVYGLSLERSTTVFAMAVSVALGITAAISMAWLLSKGMHLLKNQLFFKITSWILLISAAALWSSAIGKLVGENILPGWIDPLWDTSQWIRSDGTLAGVMKSLIGYNPRPSLLEVLGYACYWLFILGSSWTEVRTYDGSIGFTGRVFRRSLGACRGILRT